MLYIFEAGGPVMYVIALTALIAIVLIVERLLYFRRIKVDEEKLFQRVKASVAKGHYDEALAICDNTISPFSSLIRTGIEHREYPELAQKEVLKDAANQEIPQLERNIQALGTIASLAPLLGLLGTVTGNISAFNVLSGLAGTSDPAALARGIAEALLTTAAGIIVAIPCIIFYNFLVQKVNLMVTKMENQVTELLMLLNRSRGEGPVQSQGFAAPVRQIPQERPREAAPRVAEPANPRPAAASPQAATGQQRPASVPPAQSGVQSSPAQRPVQTPPPAPRWTNPEAGDPDQPDEPNIGRRQS